LLQNSFVHIPGIGATKERWLWEQGLHNWDDCLTLEARSVCGYALASTLESHIKASKNYLKTNNGAYFGGHLPTSEVWRMYADFKDHTAFLDIETTGFRGMGEITVIGLFDGKEPKTFVKGQNFKDFKKEIKKYALLVTYNGKQFDVPFLRDSFGDVFTEMAHFDLRFPLRRLGYTGGLKAIQSKLGFDREDAISCLDGQCAVWLWEEYKAGNKKALDTLLRYNLEDVVVLQSLAEFVYNEFIQTLPVPIKKLRVGKKPLVNIPYDAALVKKLAKRRLNYF
jgi:hypothetical protein